MKVDPTPGVWASALVDATLSRQQLLLGLSPALPVELTGLP